MSKSSDNYFASIVQNLGIPLQGEPGISTVWVLDEHHGVYSTRPLVVPDREIYCFYGTNGDLLGWVMYFVSFPYRGSLDMATHPDHQGEGICRALLHEVVKTRKIDIDRQKYTPEGRAAMEGVVRDGLADDDLGPLVPWIDYYRERFNQMEIS